MAGDVADLGFAIDSSQMVAATVASEKMAVATKAVEAATDRQAAAAQRSSGANAALAVTMQAMQSQMVAMAGGLGLAGVALSAFGPAGLAAAVAIKLVSDAISFVIAESRRMGEGATELRKFADVVGLSIMEVKALKQAGAELGISSEVISSSFLRLTAQMTQAGRASGTMFDEVRNLRGALAEQLIAAKDEEERINILAKAYNSATDASIRATIARAAFGRQGMAQGPILDTIAMAGGIQNLVKATKDWDGATEAQTRRWDAMSRDIAQTEKRAKNIFASIFTSEGLAAAQTAAHLMERLAVAAKDAAEQKEGLSGFQRFFMALAQQSEVLSGIDPDKLQEINANFAAMQRLTKGMGSNLGVDQKDLDSWLDLADKLRGILAPAEQVKKTLEELQRTAIAKSNLMDARVGALGAAATIDERRQQTLLKIEKDRLSNLFSTIPAENILLANRAKYVANLDATIQRESARIGLLGDLASVNEHVKKTEDDIAKAIATGTAFTQQEIAAMRERARIQATAAIPENQVKFERELLFLSDQEGQIKQKLIGWGIEYNGVRGQALAQELRINETIKQAIDLTSTSISSFAKDISAGVKPMDALVNAAKKLDDTLIDVLSRKLAQSLFSGLADTGTQTAALSTAHTTGATAGLAILTPGIVAAFTEGAGAALAITKGAATADAATKIAGAATAAKIDTATADATFASRFGAATASAGVEETAAVDSAATGYAGAQAEAATKINAANVSSFTTLSAGLSAAAATILSGAVFKGFVDAASAVWAFATQNWLALIIAAIAAIAAAIGLSGNSAEKQRQKTAIQGYRDRAVLAGTDTNTLQGSLTEFDIRARAERAALPNGGLTQKSWTNTLTFGLFGDKGGKQSQELIELEKAQAAERLKVIADFNAKAVEAEKQAEADRLALIEDFGRAMNEVSGKGFLNDFTDLFKQIASYQTAGADPGQLGTFLTLSAQKIVDDSKLTGDAFQDLLTTFPQLTGVVHEFNEAAVVAVRAASDIASAQQSFSDRLFAATNDASTRTGALAAFDRKADQERAAEAEAGGQAMAGLEAALAAERLGVIKTFADQAAAAEQAAADRRLSAQDRLFNALNDTSTLAGALAAFDRQAAADRLTEQKAGGAALTDLVGAQEAERLNIVKKFAQQAVDAEQEAAQQRLNAINAAAKNIVDYVSGLLAGPNSGLSPQARLNAAQATYNATLALAQGGNIDAQSRITEDFENLRRAAQDFYGSSSAYQTLLSTGIQQLLALPAVALSNDPLINALAAAAQATINNTTSTNDNTNAVGVNASAFGSSTSALTTSTSAFGTHSSAIGTNNSAFGSSTSALTTNTSAFGTNSSAIGTNSGAFGSSTSALTTNTSGFGTNSAALTTNTSAHGTNSAALTTNTSAFGTNSLALGTNTSAFGTNSSALGTNTGAFGTNSSALTTNTGAFGTNSSALGTNTGAFGTNSSALGTNTGAFGTNSSALTTNTSEFGTNSTALGTNTGAFGTNSSAIGTNSGAFGLHTSATNADKSGFGLHTSSMESNSNTFGSNTSAIGTNTGAFGTSTSTLGTNNSAFGSVTNVVTTNTSALGNTTTGVNNTMGPNGTISTFFGPSGVLQTVMGPTGTYTTSLSNVEGSTSDTADRLGPSAADGINQLLRALFGFGGFTHLQWLANIASNAFKTVNNLAAIGASSHIEVGAYVVLGTGTATGGLITGPGTGTSDSIMRWLSNGEYVINAASTARLGVRFLDEINAGRTPMVHAPAWGRPTNDNDVLAELTALRRELAAFRRENSAVTLEGAKRTVEPLSEIAENSKQAAKAVRRKAAA